MQTFPCVDCQTPLNLYEIGKDFKKMLKDLEWARCPNCESSLLPKLRIKYYSESVNESDIFKNYPMIGECSNNVTGNYNINSYDSNSNSSNSDFDEAEVLYSPFYLKFIESRLKLDLETFKMKFNAIFWNSLWYFDIKNLPYDFLMPYISNGFTNENYFSPNGLFIQNIRLNYTNDKQGIYSKLCIEKNDPQFFIDEEIKSNLIKKRIFT
jgi:hypothetical protein